MTKLSEPNIRLVINDQEELSMKLFAFSWMDGELCEPFQELGKMAAQLEEESAALKRALHELAQFDYRLGIDAMRKFAFDALPADTQDIPDRPTPPEPSRT